jgi:hypothetical protein
MKKIYSRLQSGFSLHLNRLEKIKGKKQLVQINDLFNWTTEESK